MKLITTLGLVCVQIIQMHGGAVDPTFSSRCTHLLCESQVSSMYAQVSSVASAATAAVSLFTDRLRILETGVWRGTFFYL